MVVEGITATEVAYEISKKLNVDMPITSAIYSILLPCPIKIPALLFLLCILVQVTIKSPIPDNPEKVEASAPIV